MATVTIPTHLLDNKKLINAFIEAFHEEKFLPNYWITNMPQGELRDIKLFTDGDLVIAQSTVIYDNAETAFRAVSKLQAYIRSSKEILFNAGRERNLVYCAGRERNLVYYNYNLIKL